MDRKNRLIGVTLCAALQLIPFAAETAKPLPEPFRVQQNANAVQADSAAPTGFAIDDRSSAIVVPAGRDLTPATFFSRFGNRLGLAKQDAMVEDSRGKNFITGHGVIRFYQAYRGVPVRGGSYSLIVQGDHVLWGVGRVIPGLSLEPEPTIPPERARWYARRTVASHLARRFEEVDWNNGDDARLVFVSSDGSFAVSSYVLAYEYQIRPADSNASFQVYVNAQTGEIIRARSETVEAWAASSAHGNSVYNQQVGPFDAEQDVPDPAHQLRSDEIHTFSLAFASPGPVAQLIDQLDQHLDFVSPSSLFLASGHERGVSVHWASLEALDMFRNFLGVTQLQGPDVPSPLVTNYVDAPVTDGFAFHLYPLSANLYGTQTCHIVALDVVGHEMGHVLTRHLFPWFTGDNYLGEAGSIRESFSDIMGQLLEVWVNGTSDWIGGAEITCPEFSQKKIRNLANPLQSHPPQPDVYQNLLSTSPANENNDWGHMHHNNSLQNKWFYLLANGGGGTNSNGVTYDVIGVGLSPASNILLGTMLDLPGDGGYVEVRDTSELVAGNMCGEHSQERESVSEAWRAVGLSAAPGPAPHIEPADGASAVDPWPVHLRFQVGQTPVESSWEVQISTDPGFLSGDVQSTSTFATEMVGTTEVAFAEFELLPDTQYFWRVRPTDTQPGLDCWRPTKSFTTASMAVKLITPVSELTGERYHPWELEFGWSSHPKASTYTIEVSDVPGFDYPLIQREESTETNVVLDTLVNDTHYWRVRPNYRTKNGNLIPGTWTTALFLTEMPAVQTLAPAWGESVWPWPAYFSWTNVKGADFYVFSMKVPDDEKAGSAAVEARFELPGSQTTHKLNLPANHAYIYYHWYIDVIGPKIVQRGIQQKGQRDVGYLVVEGMSTAPLLQVTGPNLCVPLHQPLALKWQRVLNASSYRIRVYEARCPKNSQCFSGGLLSSVEVGAQPSQLQSWSFSPSPMVRNDAVGIRWTAQAVGPEGVPGLESHGSIPILLQPTAPALIAPEDMARFETDDTAYLLWQSEMAPWGEYVVAVYKGSHSACDGSPDLSFVTQGVSSGQSSAKLWNFQLDSGTHNHSWRVRPVVVGLNWNNQFWDPCAHPRWSGCNRFVVEEKAPVLTKPVVYGPEEWWYGYLLAYWVKVPGADSYRIEVRIGSPSGPEFTTEEWTVSMLAANKAAWDQLVFQLGWPLPTDPSLWIAQIGGVPVGEYFWKVQACKLGTCGPPSDWVKWTELINPFP